MSIENSLKRIADALEAIAHSKKQETPTLSPESVPAPAADTSSTPATIVPTAEAPPPPPPAQATHELTTPAPVSTPAAVPVMSPEDLDAAMIAEFHRIGSREPIDNVMQTQFGVTGVTTLPAEQYQPLLDAVRAIPA